MKKFEIGIQVGTVICLAAFSMAVAAARSQDESGKPSNPDAKKAEEKKPEEKKAVKPPAPTTVHIKVSAEGVDPLPKESSIQLKGLADCDTLARRGNLDSDGQITFSELPVCKVALKILVTGFETKALPELDLAEYKNAALRIHIKQIGPPMLN